MPPISKKATKETTPCAGVRAHRCAHLEGAREHTRTGGGTASSASASRGQNRLQAKPLGKSVNRRSTGAREHFCDSGHGPSTARRGRPRHEEATHVRTFAPSRWSSVERADAAHSRLRALRHRGCSRSHGDGLGRDTAAPGDREHSRSTTVLQLRVARRHRRQRGRALDRYQLDHRACLQQQQRVDTERRRRELLRGIPALHGQGHLRRLPVAGEGDLGAEATPHRQHPAGLRRSDPVHRPRHRPDVRDAARRAHARGQHHRHHRQRRRQLQPERGLGSPLLHRPRDHRGRPLPRASHRHHALPVRHLLCVAVRDGRGVRAQPGRGPHLRRLGPDVHRGRLRRPARPHQGGARRHGLRARQGLRRDRAAPERRPAGGRGLGEQRGHLEHPDRARRHVARRVGPLDRNRHRRNRLPRLPGPQWPRDDRRLT